jgi:hypothetical protein
LTQLTIEQVKESLPAQFKKSISQNLVDSVNNTLVDPEMYEIFRDNLVTYSSVLQQGKFKLSSYLDAVKYVSFKVMGDTNIAAYSKAFPDKIKRFNAEGVTGKTVSSYVTAYNASKLVTLILKQAIIPTWLLNQDLYQKALNVQADLMMTAKSEKVRTDAANSVMTQLKQPESQKIELDIAVREDKTIDALRASSLELVARQKQILLSGAMSAKDIAHSNLITEVSFQEVDDESTITRQDADEGRELFK